MIKEQHIQLPNRQDNDDITPREQLVYIALKSYMNKDTKECFPSLMSVSELLGISIPTIRKDIKTLESLKYISIRKQGSKQIYKFNDYKSFEPFSYDFLYNKNLTATEKAYLVASQQFMFKNGNNGSINYSLRELADKINMPKSTIKDCDNSLQEKNLLTVINAEGLVQTKMFHLNEFNTAVVNTLMDHEGRLSQLEKQNELLLQELKELKNKQYAEIVL